MGRFTDREKHEQGIWVDEQNELYDFHKLVEPSDVLYPAINKLAHYEDMEEQGRLIELPCKVGDTVWGYWIDDGIIMIDELYIMNEMQAIVMKDLWGKKVFATAKEAQEEAEAKLAELKGTEE